MVITFVAALMILALGGAGYVYAGGARERQQKRFAAVARPAAQLRGGPGGDTNALKRKNVQQLLQQIENKTAEQKQRITMRRRLDIALGTVKTRTSRGLQRLSALLESRGTPE